MIAKKLSVRDDQPHLQHFHVPGAEPPALFDDVVCANDRAQAVADGVLIDVSPVAAEIGLRLPVVLTAATWSDCCAWTPADSARQTLQHVEARLANLLCGLVNSAGAARGCVIRFQLLRIPRDGHSRRARPITLKATCLPCDDGTPSITVMLTSEC